MLHAVSIDRVCLPINLVANIFVGIIPAASHIGIERMQLSIGKVIIASCFHVGLVIPGFIIIRSSHEHHPA